MVSLYQQTRAFNRMKKEHPDYPPTPMRFELLCQPTAEDVGLIDDETAYQQAIGNITPKDKAVAYARGMMGARAAQLVTMDDKSARRLFWDDWHKLIGMIDRGFFIPEAIEEVVGVSATKTRADVEAHAYWVGKILKFLTED